MKLIKINYDLYILIAPKEATNFYIDYNSYACVSSLHYNINGEKLTYYPTGEDPGWEQFEIISEFPTDIKFNDDEQIIYLKYS